MGHADLAIRKDEACMYIFSLDLRLVTICRRQSWRLNVKLGRLCSAATRNL
jgi:hypothetical protein